MGIGRDYYNRDTGEYEENPYYSRVYWRAGKKEKEPKVPGNNEGGETSALGNALVNIFIVGLILLFVFHVIPLTCSSLKEHWQKQEEGNWP